MTTRSERYSRGERVMENQWIDAFIDRLAAIQHRKFVLCLIVVCSRYRMMGDGDD